MTERERLMQAVVEAARKTAREIGATQSLFDALRALDAPPPEEAGETVEVRAAVFSNGGEAWTVYGSSHTSDQTVIRNAEAELLDGGDEEHVGWIKGTLVLPKRRLPEVAGEVEQITVTKGGRGMSARNVIVDALFNNVDFDMPFGAMADDILSVLSAAGYAVVPREPTEKILQAAAQLDFSAQHDPTWREFYQAMLAAAAKEGEG